MARTTKQRWNLIIKLAFALTFVVVVGDQILREKDLSLMWSNFLAHWSRGHVWMIGIAILLMPVNWLLETAKWRLLMRPSYRVAWWQGIRAIAGGIALSLFTPNRIGEYGGRILFVPARYNWRAIVASLTGSFSQNLVHWSCGLLAGWYLLSRSVELPVALGRGIEILAPVMCILLLVVYAHIPRIGAAVKGYTRPRWLRRFWESGGHLERISREELWLAGLFSLCRYLIFSTQFVLLLVYFGVAVPLDWLIAGVALMYLMQTSVPLPPFVDLLARSEVAILLWSAYAVNELTVLAASFFIWIINLLIPAFLGLFAISTVNVLQTLGYEQTKDPVSNDRGHRSSADGVSAGEPR
ncbi:MAG: lysylphosphatidylglycerol synthase transmembrane domain-containing protein [Saprospiraceae bacterium]|nr:lysylphosphatidylglycerol synthase transmembrane domain-containing protein [Saprospiraceae bacterium]